jgi:hypothetical protein
MVDDFSTWSSKQQEGNALRLKGARFVFESGVTITAEDALIDQENKIGTLAWRCADDRQVGACACCPSRPIGRAAHELLTDEVEHDNTGQREMRIWRTLIST